MGNAILFFEWRILSFISFEPCVTIKYRKIILSYYLDLK